MAAHAGVVRRTSGDLGKKRCHQNILYIKKSILNMRKIRIQKGKEKIYSQCEKNKNSKEIRRRYSYSLWWPQERWVSGKVAF